MKIKALTLTKLMDVLHNQYTKSNWDFDSFDKKIHEWRYIDNSKSKLDVKVVYSYTINNGEFELTSL